MEKKIHVEDRTGQDLAKVVEGPKSERGLSEGSRQKINYKRRRRAKLDAKEIGKRLFKNGEEVVRVQIFEIVRIMRDAGGVKRERQIYRALVDGVVSAARAEIYERRDH